MNFYLEELNCVNCKEAVNKFSVRKSNFIRVQNNQFELSQITPLKWVENCSIIGLTVKLTHSYFKRDPPAL